MSPKNSTRGLLTVFNELEGKWEECGLAKLVPSSRNKPKHNARNMSNIRKLGESILRV